MIAVEAKSLTKKYGLLYAVDNVSFTVEQGSIVGLVGKNGAGKTTLMRMLTGLVQPTFGTVDILPEEEKNASSVAAIVEQPSLYTGMTAMDNLRAQCILLGIPSDDKFLNMTLNLVGLSDTNQKVKNFSLGMRQRLAIAMTFVGKPKLLILDEPINGLDPQGIFDIREAFLRLNREFGTTIIISGHILSELSKLATEYFFMDNGRLIKHATASELENISAKRLRLTVSDAGKAKEILEKFGKTEVFDNIAELYGEASPSQVLIALSQAGIAVFDVQTVGENLEQYFLRLIGGAK